MRMTIFTLAAVFFVGGMLALATVQPVAADCVTCTSSQNCTNEEGSYDHCDIFYVEGEQWCNFHEECMASVEITPAILSPTGTFWSPEGEVSVDGEALVSSCAGFLINLL